MHKVLREIDKEMLEGKWLYSDKKKKAGSSWRHGDKAALGYRNRSNCDMFSDPEEEEETEDLMKKTTKRSSTPSRRSPSVGRKNQVVERCSHTLIYQSAPGKRPRHFGKWNYRPLYTCQR